MYRCLIRYDTVCVTLPWSMEAGYWITILFSLTNVIIMLWFSLTTIWIPWLSPTFPDSAKKDTSAITFPDCTNLDFCKVIVTSIRRTWRKILDFLVRKSIFCGQGASTFFWRNRPKICKNLENFLTRKLGGKKPVTDINFVCLFCKFCE